MKNTEIIPAAFTPLLIQRIAWESASASHIVWRTEDGHEFKTRWAARLYAGVSPEERAGMLSDLKSDRQVVK